MMNNAYNNDGFPIGTTEKDKAAYNEIWNWLFVEADKMEKQMQRTGERQTLKDIHEKERLEKLGVTRDGRCIM